MTPGPQRLSPQGRSCYDTRAAAVLTPGPQQLSPKGSHGSHATLKINVSSAATAMQDSSSAHKQGMPPVPRRKSLHRVLEHWFPAPRKPACVLKWFGMMGTAFGRVHCATVHAMWGIHALKQWGGGAAQGRGLQLCKHRVQTGAQSLEHCAQASATCLHTAKSRHCCSVGACC